MESTSAIHIYRRLQYSSLDKFNTHRKTVSSLPDPDRAYANRASEEYIIEEMQERYDGSANVTFDWNEFLNFEDVADD